jgi:hypothetical protein
MISFVETLANRLEIDSEALAGMICEAAQETVMHAAQGGEVRDDLNRVQLGTLLVALQWNQNPTIRQAVKVKKS